MCNRLGLHIIALVMARELNAAQRSAMEVLRGAAMRTSRFVTLTTPALAAAAPGETSQRGKIGSMPLLIGTSGWQYRDWRGGLYPVGLAQRRWLEHYATQYLTVENNASFYRLPAPETFAGWRDRTPGDFVMAVKASRYLTHVRQLRDPAEPVARLLTAASSLGRKLGPILLQLPPTLRADPAVLDACLAEFRSARPPGVPASLRIAVEPRHPTWWTGEIQQVLAAHGAALCWADRLDRPVTPLWRTAGWGYLRLHEGTADPWPSYTQEGLRAWVDRVRKEWPPEADVYVYFNNDPGGAAVANSAVFAALARDAGLPVTRTPQVGEVPLTTAIPTW
jgi:uncharacterized protein YecE (DUF72 family)